MASSAQAAVRVRCAPPARSRQLFSAARGAVLPLTAAVDTWPWRVPPPPAAGTLTTARLAGPWSESEQPRLLLHWLWRGVCAAAG